MTNLTSARSAARARLKQAIKSNMFIKDILLNLRDGFEGDVMQELRDEAENLLQCIHEYNAYKKAGDMK